MLSEGATWPSLVFARAQQTDASTPDRSSTTTTTTLSPSTQHTNGLSPSALLLPGSMCPSADSELAALLSQLLGVGRPAGQTGCVCPASACSPRTTTTGLAAQPAGPGRTAGRIVAGRAQRPATSCPPSPCSGLASPVVRRHRRLRRRRPPLLPLLTAPFPARPRQPPPPALDPALHPLLARPDQAVPRGILARRRRPGRRPLALGRPDDAGQPRLAVRARRRRRLLPSLPRRCRRRQARRRRLVHPVPDGHGRQAPAARRPARARGRVREL